MGFFTYASDKEIYIALGKSIAYEKIGKELEKCIECAFVELHLRCGDKEHIPIPFELVDMIQIYENLVHEFEPDFHESHIAYSPHLAHDCRWPSYEINNYLDSLICEGVKPISGKDRFLTRHIEKEFQNLESEYKRDTILALVRLIAQLKDIRLREAMFSRLMTDHRKDVDDIEQSRTEDTDPYDVFTLAYNLEDDKKRDTLYERLKVTGFDVMEFLDD